MLSIDVENTQKMLEKCPSIGGTLTSEIAKYFPRILFIPYLDVLAWVELLKKYQGWVAESVSVNCTYLPAFNIVATFLIHLIL